jgi:hypothetical protein
MTRRIEFSTWRVDMDEETIERIVDRFRKSLQKRAASGERIRTIDEIEAAALSLREEAGEAVAEELASSSLTGEEKDLSKSKAECRCGRTARFKGVRPYTAVTMVGLIRFDRRYYYCRRCDSGFCPVDRMLRIGRGAYTDRVQQQTVRLCTLSPYTVAVDLFKDLCGVSVSISHAQRMVDHAGKIAALVMADRLKAVSEADRVRLAVWSGELPAPPRPSGAECLYIEMDGVQTPLVRSWNEMKVGVCFSVSAHGVHGRKSYVSHLGSTHDFAPHLYAMAIKEGLDAAKATVVLGDGASWIWNLAADQFPKAIQILDLWHVLDRLGKVARSAFGEENTSLVKQWLYERKTELLASRLSDVKKALQLLAREHPASAELVRADIGYHRNNASRMDYASYLKEGLHIGSGVAESACKRVVTQRLKGAGMRWSSAAAEAMAKLRCFALSLQWGELTTWWNNQSAQQYAAAT